MNCVVSGRTLVVIGNGMVGARLCQRLVENSVPRHYRITVFGEERRPAYDRVHLSSYVEHRDPARLEIHPAEWYAAQGIELHVGEPVAAVDRTARQVISWGGRRLRYDVLVFATGSSPFLPPIPGAQGPGVFVYRTIDDLDAILRSARTCRRAAVIGGGLLGLEAAQAMSRLGLETHVVERAPYLMPQQLDLDAARVLETLVRRQGLELHLGRSPQAIEADGGGQVLHFETGEALRVDLVVVSAGIRPRTELARAAGFPCDPGGAIVVDDRLAADEAVYAIGECASHRGRVYGLAAPGYAMADVLAARLAGGPDTFEGAAPSTRLKMLGIEVVAAGDCAAGRVQIVHGSPEHHRVLFFDGDRLVGARGVGEWPEAARVQAAVARAERLDRRARRRFEEAGRLWDAGAPTVAAWGDDAVVCNCVGVSKGTLRCAITAGATAVETLSRATGAGTLCGSCRPLLADLLGTRAEPVATGAARALGLASVVTLALAAVATFAPSPPMADSVESGWRYVDVLWRETFYKQVSGFSLLGVAVLGLLLPLRKRVRRFSLGAFATWRAAHALVGASTLVLLFVHTGFRFGANLNRGLMLAFLAMSLAGALAGLAAALETRGPGRLGELARRHRGALSALHLYLTWPLPILVLFHVLSVYLY